MVRLNDRVRYDPDGNKILGHDHKWVQHQVTLTPHPMTGIAGAAVGWRCARRSCSALRVQEYKFRRPRADQPSNTFSQTVLELVARKGIGPY
jgi:hypothetical protein